MPSTKMLPKPVIGPWTAAGDGLPVPCIPATSVAPSHAASATIAAARIVEIRFRVALAIFIGVALIACLDSVLNVINTRPNPNGSSRRRFVVAHLVRGQPGINFLQEGLGFLVEELPKFRERGRSHAIVHGGAVEARC